MGTPVKMNCERTNKNILTDFILGIRITTSHVSHRVRQKTHNSSQKCKIIWNACALIQVLDTSIHLRKCFQCKLYFFMSCV